ncbi:DPP IV N-terminal domain-containing protein, partial [Acidobacteria bacterium AH-259-D05]|nr:DPP IV N-terminal domain-containing protein [Acidobacteria bacterium AH-259-D05]
MLFTVFRGTANYQIAVLSLETGEHQSLIERGRDAYYEPTGHLVYEPAGGTLMAVPFNPARLEVTGDPVPVLQGVRQNPNGAVDYTFSGDGTLAYVPTGTSVERSLLWVDRDGTEHSLTEEKRGYTIPRVSPDGRRVALTIYEDDGQRHVWIYDIERDSFSRLTFEGELNGTLIWTPDGQWITFQSTRDGPRNLYRKRADGTGPAERLTTSENVQSPNSWSPDGSVLVLQENRPGTSDDVFIRPMDGEPEPQLLISSPTTDCCAKFSPDGRWLAYVSDETGQNHVYVRPYPETEGRWLVSGEEGGGEPVWSPDGSELFYRSGDSMMVVSIQTRPTFSASRPRVLFEGLYLTSATLPGSYQYYDISPDGQRFVMITQEQGESQIHVVL